MIDLVDFGGVYISLSSIQAIVNEQEGDRETGNVYIDYGHGCRLSFEGNADDVMRIIGHWHRKNSQGGSDDWAAKPVLAAV